MLLAEPAPTPMDLRFRLFGTPVRVHPFFWLLAAILGFDLVQHPPIPGSNGMLELVTWIGVCFLSILLHEFGHVWMGQAFGSHGHIVLHSMGGLAIGASQLTQRWQRILVCAAGPGIQLLLFVGLMVLIVTGVLPLPDFRFRSVDRMFYWLVTSVGFVPPPAGLDRSPEVALLLALLLTTNLLWPLLNLLPIWPLDGGQILTEVSTAISHRKGPLVSFRISLVVAAVLAVNGLAGEYGRAFLPYAPTGWWVALLFAMLAMTSWQLIQMEQQTYRNDDYLPWER